MANNPPAPAFRQALPVLPTIEEMVAHLDRAIAGQDRPKRDLATAVYNHYMLLALNRREEAQGREPGAAPRQNLLLIGPTGSGKSYMVRTLAMMLGVPFVDVAATAFTKTGYVGDKVVSIVRQLYIEARGVRARAERGIVFIDEIDKIRRSSGTDNDVNGEGVQQALLTLLDGREYNLNSETEPLELDVSKVLFVCAGAFEGLGRIVAERLVGDYAGLVPPDDPSDADTLPTPDLSGIPDDIRELALELGRGDRADNARLQRCLDRWETRDLVQYGLIPEFIGRFSAISALAPLGRDEVIRLIAGVADAPLVQQQAHFALHGIELVFEPSALEALAENAIRLRIGARGIQRAVLRALDAVDYRLPELARSGVRRIIYRREHIHGGADPILERGPLPPKEALPSDGLREGALAAGPLASAATTNTPPERFITDTGGLSDADVRMRLEELRAWLSVKRPSGDALVWWEALQASLKDDPRRLLRLYEELIIRGTAPTTLYRESTSAPTVPWTSLLDSIDFDIVIKWHSDSAANRENPMIPAPPRPPTHHDDPILALRFPELVEPPANDADEEDEEQQS